MGAVAKKTLAEAPLKIKVPFDPFRAPNVHKVEGFARLMSEVADECGGCEHVDMHHYLDAITQDVHCGLCCKVAHRHGNRCKKELEAQAWKRRQRELSASIMPFEEADGIDSRMIRNASIDWSKIEITKGRSSPNEWRDLYLTQPGEFMPIPNHDDKIDASNYAPIRPNRDKPMTVADDAW